MKKFIQNDALMLGLCLLAGFLLRFYTFDQRSLWLDEVYTFEDSRDDLKAQFKFYQENSTFLHPPLFFILTHQLYPFPKPERDLRIIPLIFGTLSIPLIYLLARSFATQIALPCAISMTLMAYHICISQDGRVYSFLMFFGMLSLFLLIRYLKTFNRIYLILSALVYNLLFFSSYSSIPFIVFSQILWFYQPRQDGQKPKISSFFILSGLTSLLIIAWLVFVVLNYRGQPVMDPMHTESPGSFLDILYWVLNDWVPYPPLLITSVILLTLFTFFHKNRRNAWVLLAVFVFPIAGLYLFCKVLNVTHFVTSRYFINFLPPFFIALYLSLHAIETRFQKLKKWMRLRLLFVILFVLSNMVILPLYYQSEKQDFRGLVNYLQGHLQEGDRIFVTSTALIPGILHYFNNPPKGRHHVASTLLDENKQIEYQMPFIYQNKIFRLYNAKSCCTQFVADGNRLWIVVEKMAAKKFREGSPAVLKGYFDGSFLNFNRFPTDASMYLFLWDPKNPDEKGIEMPIE